MLQILQSPEVIVALASAILCGIIWNIRLEGKQVLHKALFTAELEALQKEQVVLKAQIVAEIMKRENLEAAIREDLTAIKLTMARMVAVMEDRLGR